MAETCVLAFSGGLDTSVCVAWLRETFGFDVVCLTVDVGQGAELDGVRVRADAAGAADLEVLDAREEFVTEFCWPALKANAMYEGRYPLVSALSRPLIAKHLVRVARERNAVAIAHGCTGKGNDQVRFETSIAALAPDLRIIAPIRETAMQRDQALAYAREHGIPVVATAEKPYSVDENLWGRAIESGVLEDPWAEPPEKDVFEFTVPVDETPETAAEVVIGFQGGVPVSLDGEAQGALELVRRMHDLAGAHGVGRIDMIENRSVGIKSRELYEAPAALVLVDAHRALEDLTLTKAELRTKKQLEETWTNLVYEGHWFSPLRSALDAFVDTTQEVVTGEVRVALRPGAATVNGRRSPNALYAETLASYGAGETFPHEAAAGYIRIVSLETELRAALARAKEAV
jgi:argininosuccinate synthase